LNIRAIDYLGAPQAGKTVAASLEYRGPSGNWRDGESVAAVARATVTTDADGRATWTTTMPQAAGDYRLRAETTAGGR